MKDKITHFKKEILTILLIFFLFIFVSYWTKANLDEIKNAISSLNTWGPLAYVFAMTIAVVIAPVSALPLVPIAVGSWGNFNAAILSMIGWMSGSCLAFALAKYGGKPIIKKFIDLEKLEKYSKLIPEKNLFISIIFLRMALPVDLLSYALGLFTNIKWSTYLLATLIGIAPFSFIFSYAVNFPIEYQIVGGLIGLIIIGLGYLKINGKKNGKNYIT